MSERQVENYLREYLESIGWEMLNKPRRHGQHGIDIKARKTRWNRYLYVELKKDSKHASVRQTNINSALGQIMIQMDKKGNIPNSSRIYALGFPKTMQRLFINKFCGSHFGFRQLKLRTYWVSKSGEVEELAYSQLLRLSQQCN